MKKQIISFLFFVSLLILPFQTASAATADWDNVPASDWMKYVDGNLRITQINLPGTHDSSTQYVNFSYWSQCQDTDIATQLKNGIRFLDIRLKGEDSDGVTKLRIVHGSANCKTASGDDLYLDTILNECYRFLDKHPTETIIMSLKKDNGDVDESAIQRSIYQNYIGNNLNKYWFVGNGKPVLNQVRGKIVLARRFSDLNNYGDTKGGLNLIWGDQGGSTTYPVPYVKSQVTGLTALWVQDRYEYGADDKWNAVKYGLDYPAAETVRESSYFLNYLSTAGNSFLKGPSSYADTLNKKFLNYQMTSGKAYGWIIMDFANADLAKHVYSTNILQKTYNQ